MNVVVSEAVGSSNAMDPAAALDRAASIAEVKALDPAIRELPHYVYALVARTEAATLGGHAIIDPQEPVCVVPAGRFSAIVSACGQDEIDPTRRNLLAHTRVLETAMRAFTLLPVRFGTILPGLGALERVLKHREDELVAMYESIEGHIELGLKVTWDPEAILKEVLAESSHLLKLHDRIKAKPAAKAYYDKIDFGRRLEDAMNEKREALAGELLSRLRPLTQKATEIKRIDDRMVINAAFLLEAKGEARFDAAISMLAREHEGSLHFRYVGPVPPYNFVKLSIDWTS